MGAAAVVGVGETDYADDYRRRREPDRPPRDAYSYGVDAFRRALADAGLCRDDVDGLVAGPPLAAERTAEILGLDPHWAATGDHAHAVWLAAMALATGAAGCVALVYGNDQRSAGVRYGGAATPGAALFLAYDYFAPWGLTSQGALYALMARRYREVHGLSEEALAEVAVHQRRFAATTPGAVMTRPLTVADYLASPYVVEPLHLLDYCLVNDGGVCLILTTPDRAAGLGPPPVTVAAFGRAEADREATSLRPRLGDLYHPAHRRAAAQLREASGVGPEDVACVQIYDSFSIHVPVALEGFGFFPEGEADAFLAGGGLRPGGRLAVNTAGGHLSGSYMQGWGHQVEAVRQLRGHAGARQQPGLRHVQYIGDAAGKVTSILYRKGR
ncbi:thiolase family protein [Pseudonocardia sp.]|uniref:thiolase family protein n=1 Tax=Pseudonocardia sp. TaxID=60912 RepID=UPI003D13A1D6